MHPFGAAVYGPRLPPPILGLDGILLVDAQVSFPVTIGHVPPIPVPADPNLVGTELACQLLAHEGEDGPVTAWSNGVEFEIGGPHEHFGVEGGILAWLRQPVEPGGSLDIGSTMFDPVLVPAGPWDTDGGADPPGEDGLETGEE